MVRVSVLVFLNWVSCSAYILGVGAWVKRPHYNFYLEMRKQLISIFNSQKYPTVMFLHLSLTPYKQPTVLPKLVVTRDNGKITTKNYPAQIKNFMSSVLSCTLSRPLAQINPSSQRKTNSWFFRLLSQHLQPVILKSALTGLCYQQRLFQKDPPLWKMPNLICLMFLPQGVPLLLETFHLKHK